MSEYIGEGELSLFADDTSAYCFGKNHEEVVNALNWKWCTRNKMSVHPRKSKAIIIRKVPFIGPLRPIYFGNSMPDDLKQIGNLNTLKRKLKTRLKEINNFQFEKEAVLINNKKDILSIIRLFFPFLKVDFSFS